MTHIDFYILANSIRKHGRNQDLLIADLCARLVPLEIAKDFAKTAKGIK